MPDADTVLMRLALEEAEAALALGIMPVGAVLAHRGTAIGRAHKTMTSNHLDHAEMNLMRATFQGDHGLPRPELTLYTTLEPCLMCYATMRHLSIGRLVYALEDPYGGAAHLDDAALPERHRSRPLAVTGGVLREEVRQLLRRFLSITDEPFWRAGGAWALQNAILNE
ncbi:MAG: nucleoside deaminase [Methylobacterium frigidaeris]